MRAGGVLWRVGRRDRSHRLQSDSENPKKLQSGQVSYTPPIRLQGGIENSHRDSRQIFRLESQAGISVDSSRLELGPNPAERTGAYQSCYAAVRFRSCQKSAPAHDDSLNWRLVNEHRQTCAVPCSRHARNLRRRCGSVPLRLG